LTQVYSVGGKTKITGIILMEAKRKEHANMNEAKREAATAAQSRSVT